MIRRGDVLLFNVREIFEKHDRLWPVVKVLAPDDLVMASVLEAKRPTYDLKYGAVCVELDLLFEDGTSRFCVLPLTLFESGTVLIQPQVCDATSYED